MKPASQVKLLLKMHKLENDGEAAEGDGALQRLEKRLDPSLRRRYRKYKDKTGVGIAVLIDRICNKCKMIYPETHEMLRYKNFVHSCEYCGRLLIVTDKSA